MSGLWEKVKQHPWMTGLIVLGVFILVYLLVGGSSSPTQSGGNNNYAAEVAAATQLQEAQLQAQSQGNAINASLQGQQAQYQAAITIAQLQAQSHQADISASQTVASQQIAAQQQVQDAAIAAQSLQTTTNGQIAANYLTTQQNIASITSTAQQNIYTEYFANQSQAQKYAYAQSVSSQAPQLFQEFMQAYGTFGQQAAMFGLQATDPNVYFSNPWAANYYGNNPSIGNGLGAPGNYGQSVPGVNVTTGGLSSGGYIPNPQLPQIATPQLQPLPFGSTPTPIHVTN